MRIRRRECALDVGGRRGLRSCTVTRYAYDRRVVVGPLADSMVYENGLLSDVSPYVPEHIGMHELKTDEVSGQATLRLAILNNLGRV